MKVFKVHIELERKMFKLEGYLVKENDIDNVVDVVDGYMKVVFLNSKDEILNYLSGGLCSGKLSYIRGLCSGKSLVLVEEFNDSNMLPNCYCFIDVNKPGFYATETPGGFFPVCMPMKCSDGHATIRLEEITVNKEIVAQRVFKIVKEYEKSSIYFRDPYILDNFLEPEYAFHMESHCGKW